MIFSVVGVVVITMLILFVGYIRLKNEKSFSPEEEVVYTDGDLPKSFRTRIAFALRYSTERSSGVFLSNAWPW